MRCCCCCCRCCCRCSCSNSQHNKKYTLRRRRRKKKKETEKGEREREGNLSLSFFIGRSVGRWAEKWRVDHLLTLSPLTPLCPRPSSTTAPPFDAQHSKVHFHSHCRPNVASRPFANSATIHSSGALAAASHHHRTTNPLLHCTALRCTAHAARCEQAATSQLFFLFFSFLGRPAAAAFTCCRVESN